jgi:hypothetical protein
MDGEAVAAGEPLLYAKVPAPGRPASDKPAIVGPARTKAMARMKLRVRILTVSGSPCPAQLRRFRGGIDSQRVFPDVCAKSAKWFRRTEELFRRLRPTKQFAENLNDFRGARRTDMDRADARDLLAAAQNPVRRPAPVVHWTSSRRSLADCPWNRRSQ